MRKFSSYGPINKDLHYYAPRMALIDHAYWQLSGDDPARDGRYITVFIEAVDDDNRRKFEVAYKDSATGVTVNPLFIVTG